MTSPNPHAQVLTAIEAELRRLGLWSDTRPSAAALRSQMPFCFDTLAFEQWLQWVLLPRIWALLQQGAPLPPHSGIAPLAEVYFEQQAVEATDLIALLREFDRLLETGKCTD